MAIMTVAEVKVLLQISDATYDTIIAALLPVVQDFIVTYCGNGLFKDDNKQIADSISIAFVEGGGSADTITDSDSEFISVGEFEADMDIAVEGAISNDGIYTIDTVIAGIITLVTDDDLVDEAAGESVTITRMKWPKGIQKFVAQMIWEDIVNMKNSNVKSEKIGDYAVTFFKEATTEAGGYSESILAGLNNWRCVRFR